MTTGLLTSTSLKRKSGIEVFQEERQRAQQSQCTDLTSASGYLVEFLFSLVRELEEAVEHLREKLEMNEKSDLGVLAEEMRRDEESMWTLLFNQMIPLDCSS